MATADSSARSRLANRVCEFLNAGTSPSLTALISTFVVVLLAFAACVAFITPSRLTGWDSALLMDGPTDDYCDLTLRAFRLANGPHAHRSVTIVGDSSIRDAITREQELQDE